LFFFANGLHVFLERERRKKKEKKKHMARAQPLVF